VAIQQSGGVIVRLEVKSVFIIHLAAWRAIGARQEIRSITLNHSNAQSHQLALANNLSFLPLVVRR
jgi:hypothetical protein